MVLEVNKFYSQHIVLDLGKKMNSEIKHYVQSHICPLTQTEVLQENLSTPYCAEEPSSCLFLNQRALQVLTQFFTFQNSWRRGRILWNENTCLPFLFFLNEKLRNVKSLLPAYRRPVPLLKAHVPSVSLTYLFSSGLD